jgi:hypothetical protein
MENIIMPGDRVLIFDPRRYIDDLETPLSATMRPAIVLCRYGERKYGTIYPDLLDVQWEDGSITKAHFTNAAEKIK